MIEVNEENGLDYPSKALLHRLQAIDKELCLVEKMGKVDEKVWTPKHENYYELSLPGKN